jgi:OPA family glycerol-3-phosphate transporter-like MFS transporter 1/2
LVVTPEDIGLLSTYDPRKKKKQVVTEDVEVGPTGKMAIDIEVDTEGGEGPKTEDQMNETDLTASNAVGFIEAWMIPGVAPFALCLFFAKLVAYTFLYWLPFYISNTGKILSSY